MTSSTDTVCSVVKLVVRRLSDSKGAFRPSPLETSLTRGHEIARFMTPCEECQKTKRLWWAVASSGTQNCSRRSWLRWLPHIGAATLIGVKIRAVVKVALLVYSRIKSTTCAIESTATPHSMQTIVITGR